MNYHRLSSHQILPSGQDSTGSQSPEGTPTAHTTILVMQLAVTGKHAVKFQVTLTDISKQVFCFWNENRQVQMGGKNTKSTQLLLRNTTKLSGLIRASAEPSSCQRLSGSSQWLLVWRSSSRSRGWGGGEKRCWEEGHWLQVQSKSSLRQEENDQFIHIWSRAPRKAQIKPPSESYLSCHAVRSGYPKSHPGCLPAIDYAL